MQMQRLEPELQRLRDEVLNLGRMVERAIVASVDVLQRRPPTGSQPLITLDHQIAKKRLAIELDCISLIASEQPSDDDLRAITSMLEIANELERIGNYITEIARIHFLLVRVEESLVSSLADIHRMAAQAGDILHRALQAFVDQDLALARAVLSEDDAVDVLHDQVYQGLLVFMKGKSRAMIKQTRYLSQIARNLERTADRVTNICEWVAFAITGELMHTADESVDLIQEELV